jgi:hypothetical protein
MLGFAVPRRRVVREGEPTGQARAARHLLHQGVLAVTLGALFLALPWFGLLQAASGWLRGAGMLLTAVGVVLLLSHLVVQRRAIRAWAHTHLSARHVIGDWSPLLLQALAPVQFEALCAALFQQNGFEVRARVRSDDGAMDLRLHARGERRAISIVRCKHLAHGEVGIEHMLHYYGVLAAHTLKHGTYATNGGFTAEALRFATENGIRALDGEDLLAMITRRKREQQQELLEKVLE